MSSDYNAGYDAGARGNMFSAPATAEGTAGFMAGQAAARSKYEGSLEWILAPLVLWPFVLIFYPVGGVATLLTAMVAEKVALAVGLGGSPLLRWALILLPTIVVCWTVVRREQFWGMNRTYYLARHVVRLLLLAMLMNGGATNAWRTARDLPSLGWEATIAWPPQWMAVALCLVFWQLFFMRAHQFRLYWDKKLKMWFFRPKDFSPLYFRWNRSEKPVERQAPIAMPKRWGE
ncbi:MAG: hypothetical protein IT359_01165 [Gemmatimonadaceae bacterium]|nr:hypothetical protein [Gemmatimonadaceae bacterium]